MGEIRDDPTLPELAVQPGLLDTVMYAAAMWEFQRLHFDQEWAMREGLARPVVQGPLLGNYLARMLDAGMPEGFELAHLAWRNRAVVYVGENLRCGGTLTAQADGTLDAALWIRDGSDTTVVTGTARLRPSRRDEDSAH
jgi:hydroxyacyl-ACP dehydratase HTD2-like protein with hotdog domain